MSQTVRSIGTIDHAAKIATSLEHLAGEIRAGRFPWRVERCAIVLSGRKAGGGDEVAMTYLGADASTAEVIGMLTLAQIEMASQR